VPTEPTIKRAVAFFDGQNLFYQAKEAFGYAFPNYDPKLLTELVCKARGWTISGIYFYTGIPGSVEKPDWHKFWSKKLAVMGTRGIHSFTRPLRYRPRTILLPDGSKTVARVGQEKGVDVRIALDFVGLALANVYDIALIFSQDQDLSEAVKEVKTISRMQGQWIGTACAYPVGPGAQNSRGIDGTDWIKISRMEYDACLDPIDYRNS
jgi:uncharacterized LabA/DUF88 family protein